MLAEIRTGIVRASDGTVNPARAGRFGELICGDTVGKYFELAKQGQLFCASMQGGTTLGTVLQNTAVTFTLYNPSASGVLVSLLECSISFTALQVTTTTIETLVYAANLNTAAAIPTATTALTVRSALLGAGSGQAQAFSAATLPATPVVIRVFPLNAFCTVTTQLAESSLSATDKIDGAIVLQPNTAVTIQELATTTSASGIISMLWAEIPL